MLDGLYVWKAQQGTVGAHTQEDTSLAAIICRFSHSAVQKRNVFLTRLSLKSIGNHWKHLNLLRSTSLCKECVSKSVQPYNFSTHVAYTRFEPFLQLAPDLHIWAVFAARTRSEHYTTACSLKAVVWAVFTARTRSEHYTTACSLKALLDSFELVLASRLLDRFELFLQLAPDPSITLRRLASRLSWIVLNWF